MTDQFDALLDAMHKRGGSDLLLLAGNYPRVRLDGDLVELTEFERFTPESLLTLLESRLSDVQKQRWKEEKELDFALSLGNDARFRVNYYFQQGTPAAALRCIPTQIPTPEEVGLPTTIINDIVRKPHGLVLVTGPTGSGKSTTLAAMIDQINRERTDHIVTIEDPIEFLHLSKHSVVSQREIGKDTASFQNALKYVLRQNPNVVLIGEMRDWETIQSAVTIAETGHLVFATLHTNSAVQTIDRIIDVFPASQQNQIRAQLSMIVEAVISQTLLKKIGGGRIPAMEILLPTTGIRNLIREGKTHQVYAQMQMGQGATGMQTMTQSLADLVARKLVEREDALTHVTNIQEFDAYINRPRNK